MIRAVAFSLLLTSSVSATAHCPHFTAEQEWLLDAAYVLGGLKLSAIVRQESFWCRPGHPVCRSNPADGDYGSYGPAQVQLSTALLLEGLEDTPENRAAIKERMLTEDTYSLGLGARYLEKFEGLPWLVHVSRYNGAGPEARAYAGQVKEHAVLLQSCRWPGEEL